MPQVTAPDGLTINYEQWGDPDSPAVVLLHGFTSDLRMWAGQVEAFAAYYRVIAPDLRGHGRTDAPEDLAEYTMERYCDDLVALLDALSIDVCALVGCSFGGMIAVHFATRTSGTPGGAGALGHFGGVRQHRVRRGLPEA